MFTGVLEIVPQNAFSLSASFFQPMQTYQPFNHGASQADSDLEEFSHSFFPEINSSSNSESESNEKFCSVDEDSSPIKDWSADDDSYLKFICIKYKFDWKKICKRFSTAKRRVISIERLKLRYREIRGPSKTTRARFTRDEDESLMNLIQVHGLNWIKIAQYFPGRCAMSLKNRYYFSLKKNYSGRVEEIAHDDGILLSSAIDECISKVNVDRELLSSVSLSTHIDDLILDENPAWLVALASFHSGILTK